MASMAIKTSVYQHCIQNINNRFSIWLRHVWSNIKILRIFHILNRNRNRKKELQLWRHRASHVFRCAVCVWGGQESPRRGCGMPQPKMLQDLTCWTTCQRHHLGHTWTCVFSAIWLYSLLSLNKSGSPLSEFFKSIKGDNSSGLQSSLIFINNSGMDCLFFLQADF